MRRFGYCCLALLLWGLGSSQAHAYGISLVLGKPAYHHFDQTYYAYSSLFKQGRDRFHWLDFAYSDYSYVLPHERGHADSLGTLYRFSYRLRWARHFKPFLSLGAGALQVKKTERLRIGGDHNLLGHLDATEDMHYLIFGGGGYLWENRNMIIGFSIDYGHDNGHKQNFWTPVFLLSFLL